MDFKEDLSFAVDLARKAGHIVSDSYGKVQRLVKRQDEAVSDADRASQRFIAAELKKKFPSDGLVGEENETGDAITFESRNPAGRNWIVDPIDGTNNFLGGLGIFAVCIGLLDQGQPVLGVVHDVTRNETYFAAQGQGAWLNDRKIRALQTPISNNTMLMLTSNLLNNQGVAPNFPSRWLAQTNWKIRILGSAALEAAQVAAGVAHGAITLNGKLWDIAASAAIVLEAGGIVTDPNGQPIFPFDLRNYTGAKVPFLASAPAAHGQLLEEISR
jgi:myo-inositol-1(or 4)-monophosphatase